MSRARDLASGTFSGAFAADSPTFVVDAANNRVGIGTASPDTPLEVSSAVGTGTSLAKLRNSTAAAINNISQIDFEFDNSFSGTNVDVQIGAVKTNAGNEESAFFVKTTSGTGTPTERMRIDSSGNLLVGKTSADGGVAAGHDIRATGLSYHTVDGGAVTVLNRLTSDGDIALFRKDGTTVGSIANSGAQFVIAVTGQNFYLDIPSGGDLRPWTDDAVDLGAAARRWDDVYATNGTIQTSDRNEKQDIEELTEAERRVAVAAKGLLRKFRWKSSVEEKGDDARIHFGIIAQDLQAAFAAEGLDAGRYGMFISSTWWEAQVERTREVEQEDGTTATETYTVTETYEEPTEGATERTRMGIRYPELLAFIIAAL